MAQQQSVTAAGNLNINGTVIDEIRHTPIEMATVALLANNILVKSTLTDQAGKFSITVPKGNFELVVSLIGYQTHRTPIGNANEFLIQLHNESTALSEVVISGKKPLIQSKGDKIIYNATSDISNKAGSATDVLRKVPMLTVGSDGEVKMRGNGNIKVLLNGMSSGIMAKNLKDALKMIPASTIQSVEVITSPSAKYEAEGAAGIINIITKKTITGTSGNFDMSAGNLEQSVNASMNMARKKVDFSLNVNTIHERERHTTTLSRTSLFNEQPAGELYQRNDATRHDRGVFTGAGVAYRPDTLQKLSADISYWHGSWPGKSTLYNNYTDKNGVSEYNQRSHVTELSHYFELAMSYQKKFNRKNQELQIRGLIGSTKDKSDYTTNQYDLSGFNFFRETGPNKGKAWDIDFQTDYTQPLNESGRTLLETGVRFSRTNSSSIYTVFNNAAQPGNNDLLQIPSRSDAMNYFRNIYAAYISLKFETANNWTFRPGLRFEGTQLSSNFKSSIPAFNASFNNWVPSMLIAKKINENNEFKLSYTERIRRPWIWDLNPYVNASDPRNLISGNVSLRPERTRMLEAGHNYSTPSGLTLNSSIYYSSNTDAIESLTTVDSLGISRTMPKNIAANKRLGSNVNVAVQLADKLLVNGGLELYRVWYKSTALGVSNNATFYSTQLNVSYEISDNYTVQASGDYNNGWVSLQGKNSANWFYRISAQKQFWDKKASILLSFNNPFQPSLPQKSIMTAATFRSMANHHYFNQSFSISFSWKFGSITNKPDQEDEKQIDMKPQQRGRHH